MHEDAPQKIPATQWGQLGQDDDAEDQDPQPASILALEALLQIAEDEGVPAADRVDAASAMLKHAETVTRMHLEFAHARVSDTNETPQRNQ